MTRMIRTAVGSLVASAALALAFAPPAHAESIKFKAPSTYPEGVAFNPKTGEIFVSSMRLGTIGAVKPDGTYREFASDPQLVSAVGMHADPARGRLLVCVSDPGVSVKTQPATQKKLARLMAFDIATGKKLQAVELSPLAEGQHFCNDLAVDSAGNVFVTDSFAPIVYKVDPKYKPSIYLQSDSFKGEGFNLNGIVHLKDGNLLIAKSSDGTLWKLSEKDPKKLSEVKLPEKLVNADGLVLTADGALLVIQNRDARVTRLKTKDGWKTAVVDKTMDTPKNFPTTGVIAGGGKTYVMLSRLNELFADPAKAKNETFELLEVAFP
jgi:sugar lactone lactonase YvrE